MWRNTFEFKGGLTLEQRDKLDYKTFVNRQQLIEFLKLHGVRLDDPDYPLEITKDPHAQSMYIVKQWTVIGWLREYF